MKVSVYLFCQFLLFLHISDTLIMGYRNLAANKESSQSTTKTKVGTVDWAGTLLIASLAIDGDKNQDGEIYPGCAQTVHQSNSWWRVDLESSSRIDEIKIWLRTDLFGLESLPNDYNIYLTDSGECGSGNTCDTQLGNDRVIDVTCSGVGQWIVICGRESSISQAVAICEVEIYGCAAEMYGSNCEFECGHCFNSHCILDNGFCPGKCETNYWGDRCDNVCVNCDQSGCEKSGCIHCNPGSWNSDCLSTCPANCAEGTCDRYSGECEDCKTGFYGVRCDTACSSTCDDQGCRQSDGLCLGCVTGYWGDVCPVECPDHCDDRGCSQIDGSCYGCDDGYWDTTCSTTCGMCLDTQCSQTDGTCGEDGCERKRWGENCTEICPINCVNDTCYRYTGHCYSCRSGMWNEMCGGSCSPNCISNECVEKQSVCIKECTVGYIGSTCIKDCSAICDDEGCRQSDGHCFGCVSGYWGDMCTQTCPVLCDDRGCTQTHGVCYEYIDQDKCGTLEQICQKEELIAACAVGFVMGVTMVIVVGLSIHVVRRRFQRIKKPTEPENDTEMYQTENKYENLASENDISTYETLNVE